MNELLLIDCMEYMKTCSDNAFDLAIVDPPYGINVKTNIGRRAGTKNDNPSAVWDKASPSRQFFNDLFRCSKNQIIWGANYFISKFYLDSKCWLMWDKGFSSQVSFSQFELAWTSFNDRTSKKFEMAPQNKIRIHPTQKPVALYKWLLQNYAEPEYKLFDSHSGSGSFRIAAHDLGFDLVSCELDPDYCRDNEARFQKHIQQNELFSTDEIQKSVFLQKEFL